MELYEVKTKLEDERGRNRKLTAQINRDHETSSIPSSIFKQIRMCSSFQWD
ncbi:MAG: hypothetical protein FWH57_09085 [Oscillospiraceae bacterium]|nr:hypothetical protein [Oscillospiraceae bacterium]